MRFFRKLRPRQSISVSELKDLSHQVSKTVAPVRTVGGNIVVNQSAHGMTVNELVDYEEKTVKITHVQSGSVGQPRKYGFVEMWMNEITGALAEVTMPLRVVPGATYDETFSYAISEDQNIVYEVDDIVKIRRSKRNVDVFEILKGGSAKSTSDTGIIGPYLTDVSITLADWEITCNADGTFTLTANPTLVKTYGQQTITVEGPPINVTLPAPSPPPPPPPPPP